MGCLDLKYNNATYLQVLGLFAVNLHILMALFLDLDIQYRAELNHDPDVDKVKVVTQCYSFIEASSNNTDVNKLTNGETVSFWQSDGSARSHWIRQDSLVPLHRASPYLNK